MGAQQSREEEERDTESEEEETSGEEEEEEEEDREAESSAKKREATDLAAAIGAVSLNNQLFSQLARLYRHVDGQWKLVNTTAEWKFVRGGNEDEDDDEGGRGGGGEGSRGRCSNRSVNRLAGPSSGSNDEEWWYLLVRGRTRVAVCSSMNTMFNPDSRRVDFCSPNGVWALRFADNIQYEEFANQLSNCSFENTYGLEATESNFLKIAGGKDYVGWLKGEDAVDAPSFESEDEEEPRTPTRAIVPDVREATSQAIGGANPQSIIVGAGANSFLLHDGGVDVWRNTDAGMERAGTSFSLTPARGGVGGSAAIASPIPLTPSKGLLMRAERNLLLMSPCKTGPRQATSLHQMDVERGSVVAQWDFKKDGVPIPMREICGDTKSSQLEDRNTFLGLDDSRLCRWDMRVKQGLVQDLTKPVALDWADGHNFSRGTNFRCMATTGDGCVAVGSEDGKVRLYSTTSMRQAKTCFPGLGSPITAIDVTFDGHWVLATTDAFLMLVHCVFRDKDGREKTGFHGRMGSNIRAPRLLKVKPEEISSVPRSGLSKENIQFRKGQFSWVTESGRQERSIVAAAGNSTVMWNFRRAKQTDHDCYTKNGDGLKTCYCYKLKRKSDMVVDSRFMHDNFHGPGSPEAPIVVATPADLTTFHFQ